VTIHEAMSRGIPVIAYGRGCIPEIIGADCGLVIDPADPFVPAALAKLESWLAEPARLRPPRRRRPHALPALITKTRRAGGHCCKTSSGRRRVARSALGRNRDC